MTIKQVVGTLLVIPLGYGVELGLSNYWLNRTEQRGGFMAARQVATAYVDENGGFPDNIAFAGIRHAGQSFLDSTDDYAKSMVRRDEHARDQKPARKRGRARDNKRTKSYRKTG